MRGHPTEAPSSASVPDGLRGPALQGAAAAAACAVVAGGIVLAGWDRVPIGEPAWAPPAWVGSAVWVGLFTALGIARGRLSRAEAARPSVGATGRLDVLMANILLYPLYTLGFSQPLLGLCGNLLTIGLCLWAAAGAWPRSRAAAVLIALPVPWVEFATLLVLAELGWL